MKKIATGAIDIPKRRGRPQSTPLRDALALLEERSERGQQLLTEPPQMPGAPLQRPAAVVFSLLRSEVFTTFTMTRSLQSTQCFQYRRAFLRFPFSFCEAGKKVVEMKRYKVMHFSAATIEGKRPFREKYMSFVFITASIK